MIIHNFYVHWTLCAFDRRILVDFAGVAKQKCPCPRLSKIQRVPDSLPNEALRSQGALPPVDQM